MTFTNTDCVKINWYWQFVRCGGEVAMQVKYQVRNQVSDQVLNQVYKQINPIRNIISQDINN
jgi:hypothetical protein